MVLNQNLIDFRANITELNQHIQFAHQKYANRNFKLAANLRKFISESAFLKMFVAWETFVESSFIDYLINEESILHRRPAKWASADSFSVAESFVLRINIIGKNPAHRKSANR